MNDPKDISTEAWREYTYTDGYIIHIVRPKKLYIADSGSHRVFDGNVTTYIPAGWRKIVWKAIEDGPDCSF